MAAHKSWIPWRLAPDSDPEERLIITTADGEDEITGIVYDEKNAGLIAAAPDLKGALKEITSMFKEAHEASKALEGDEHEEDCSYCAVIAEAEKALAKAESISREG